MNTVFMLPTPHLPLFCYPRFHLSDFVICMAISSNSFTRASRLCKMLNKAEQVIQALGIPLGGLYSPLSSIS